MNPFPDVHATIRFQLPRGCGVATYSRQRFVFFGDTADGDKGAVDPDVQRQILAKHPDRMIAGIVLKTKPMKDPQRIEGLHLVNNYAEASAVLFKLGVITRAEALGVMNAARDQGLAITDPQMSDLLTSP
jgi:hypothetical protein